MLASYTLKPGNGTPIVFLHGFLGTSADWIEVCSYLPFHCIGFDLPGHGNSPFTHHFYDEFFETTKQFTSFHLIGYSMGGRLALQLAMRHPEKILSLRVLSAHLGLKTEAERSQRLAKDRMLAQEILETPVDEFLKRWYDQPLFKTLISKMDIRSMRKKQNRDGLSKAVEAFSLGRQPDFSNSLNMDTILFAGEFDETYRAHYQGLKHIIIKDAGHAAHLENPQGLATTILKSFL